MFFGGAGADKDQGVWQSKYLIPIPVKRGGVLYWFAIKFRY
jgi:hypothetical protein